MALSRWNATAVLVMVTDALNDEGSPVETHEERQVFCNLRHMGATEWQACKQAGLQADGQIQVFSSDYHGEQRVVVRGITYDIERVLEIGDYTHLTLARRLGRG